MATIGDVVDKVKRDADKTVRAVVIEAFSRVIKRSPVDTGLFRGNWQYGDGRIPSGTVSDIDKSGTKTRAKVVSEVKSIYAGSNIYYLVNNLPYANRLEYGWSKSQAPHGMVRLTAAEFDGIVKLKLGGVR